MTIRQRKMLLFWVVSHSGMDALFIWLLLLARYPMRTYYDLVYGGALPVLSRWMFRKAVPEYSVSLALVALCYGLGLAALGLRCVSRPQAFDEAAESLVAHVLRTKAVLLTFAVFYLVSCLFPFVFLIDYLKQPEPDHAHEWSVAVILTTLFLLLSYAAVKQGRRLICGEKSVGNRTGMDPSNSCESGKAGKIKDRRILEFVRHAAPQSDEDFVAACDLGTGRHTGRIALGVREVVARLGLVEPRFIRADARFLGQISQLPFWDSLDFAELIMTLEEEFGVGISPAEAERIRCPTANTAELTVAQFVRDVHLAVQEKLERAMGPCPRPESTGALDGNTD